MKERINLIIVIGILFGLIFAMTYPLFFHLNSYIPGFFSTDESYSVLWNAWFVKFSHINHTSLQKTDLLMHPFGQVFFAGKPIGTIFFLINYFLALLTNPILTYNIQVSINFFLNALFVFLLVRYLTGSLLAALFSGITFGFCPYVFARAWQHLGETYLWAMPLFLLALFKLNGEKGSKVKILFFTSVVFSCLNFDVAYYNAVIFTVIAIYYSLRNRGLTRENFKATSIIFLGTLSIMLLEFYPIFLKIFNNRNATPSPFNIYHRPFEDLFVQSARPLSYLLPAAVHPIFGSFTQNFIGSPLYGLSFTEHTLYLGITSLVLAFIAVKRFIKNRAFLSKEDNFYIGLFFSIGIVAWIFSQSPWWSLGSLKIYMPSFFIYKIFPMFRAYCRFGIVVMFAVSILAGFGLKIILEKFNSGRIKVMICGLFCALVLFEFWNYPPFEVIDVSKMPQVYYHLKEQPGKIAIAEYPLDLTGPSEMYKLYQTVHEKAIINAPTPDSYAHRVLKSIAKLSDPKTAGVLKWLGVKYALVHEDGYLKTGLIEDIDELRKIPKNQNLKFIKKFPSEDCIDKQIRCIRQTGPITVYEVVADPQEFKE